MLKMSNFAFSKLNEEIQMVNEAEKEGRLDEVPVLIPLLYGAARTLGPMAARALAKKFGKKAITKVGGKFKPGMHPNSVKSQIKPGGGDGVLKQIYKNTPFKRTAGGVSVADYIGGGSGSGRTLGTDAYNTVMGGNSNSNSNSNSKSNSNNAYTNNNYSSRNLKQNQKALRTYGEGVVKKSKTFEEYSGADAVIDKNGKKHDPKSTSGKMIINMKCNNPNVSDKTGCGKGKLGKEEKNVDVVL